MAGLREKEIDIVTSVLTVIGRGLAGLSDRSLMRVLTTAKKLVRDEGAREGIGEVIDAVKDGPPNTTTLRRLLKESKYDELRDFVSEHFFYREMDIEEFCP